MAQIWREERTLIGRRLVATSSGETCDKGAAADMDAAIAEGGR